ncbi:putative phage recombination protein [Ralstonia phage RSK1]|uniref:Putative phage recombination protein n=1 Tax=Ralstonia phage RSK1 TaxID=1417599 RepID=U6C6J0_9CAUD|nr:single strand annealing protein [Ralstonia phage RSK1]BAO04709.1 putative phage recombination protein [Ralstonia phage RSK1]
MNALAKTETTALATLSEPELLDVLQSSLYPGASHQSIKMVLGYCKAAGLDPMRKPVHIVPMWDSKTGQMRDVVMPGIGLYRTDAARTGEYAGITEPEFGPDKTEVIGGVEITFPQWCRVTVSRRMPSGDIVKFTASEFWKENYAVKGGKEKSIAPNLMWQKRPYGQIAKCAEAQALRKAFPEVGSQPTADEMEGKTLDMGPAEIVSAPPAPQIYNQADFEKNLPAWEKQIVAGRLTAVEVIQRVETKAPLTEEQKARILSIKRGTPSEATDAQPKTGPTYAQVAELIHAAATHDDLDALDETVGSVADAQHRAELVALVEQRRNEIPAF